MLATSFRWVWLALAIPTGCARVDAPVVGRYRAVIATPGGELPFHIDVTRENEQFVIYLWDGDERTRATAVQVTHRELVASFTENQSTLRASASRKALVGTMSLNGRTREVPIEARLGRAYRFYEESSTDNVDVEGRWEVTFTDEAGTTLRAIALLDQEHDRVIGNITINDGSHQAVEGQVHDRELQLSSFDGRDGCLYKLEVTSTGDLVGGYWTVLGVHRNVRAVRNADATRDNTSAQHIHLREMKST